MAYRIRRPLPRVQPTYPVELDRTTALGRSVAGLWHFTDPHRAVNLARPGAHDAIPTSPIATLSRRSGRVGGMVSSATIGEQWSLGDIEKNDALAGASGDLTVFAFLYFAEGLSGNTFPRIFDQSTAGAGIDGWTMYADEGGNVVKFSVNGSTGTVGNYRNNNWQTWGVSFSESWTNRARFYLDGDTDGNLKTVGSAFDGSGSAVAAGLFNWQRTDNARTMGAPVPLVAIWPRVLTANEHRALARDPFSMLVPTADPLDALSAFLSAGSGPSYTSGEYSASISRDVVAQGAVSAGISRDVVAVGSSSASIGRTILAIGSDAAGISRSIIAAGQGDFASGISRTIVALGADVATISRSITFAPAVGSFAATIARAIVDTPTAFVGSFASAVSRRISAIATEGSTPGQGETYPIARELFERPTGQAQLWTPTLWLDGVDVSEALVGEIEIDAEAGAAMVARFSSVQFLGPISVAQWVGKAARISYALADEQGRAVSRDVFVGLVDTVDFDPVTRLATFSCTDDLQGALRPLTREQVDALTPGARWTSAIFDDEADSLEYARDRVKTIAADLHLNRQGVPVLAPWASGAVRREFTASDVLDQSLAVSLTPRRELRNVARLDVKYRAGVLGQAERVFDWSYPMNLCEWKAAGTAKLTKSMLQSALDSAGWFFADEPSFTFPPVSGTYQCPGGSFNWVISDAVRLELLDAFIATVGAKFSTYSTQTYLIEIRAEQSARSFGDLVRESAFDLAHDGDDVLEAWDELEGPQDLAEFEIDGATNTYLQTVTDEAERAEFIEAALSVEYRAILASHRANEVSFQIPIDATLDRGDTLRVVTGPITATGVCKRITHRLDASSGRAVSEITLAVSRHEDDQATTPTPLVAPPAPAIADGNQPTIDEYLTILENHIDADPSAVLDPDWVGYIAGAEIGGAGLPHVLRLPTPEVGAPDLAAETTATYLVEVPQDELVMGA